MMGSSAHGGRQVEEEMKVPTRKEQESLLRRCYNDYIKGKAQKRVKILTIFFWDFKLCKTTSFCCKLLQNVKIRQKMDS